MCPSDRNHTSVTVESSLVHEGAIKVLQTGSDVRIIFKGNDIHVFPPISGLERMGPALGIEPQTQCFFSLLSIGCGGKPGGAVVRNNCAPFKLDARKCFPATFTRTLPPLAARPSSQIFSRLLLRSSRIETVMFGRSKKRRDDAGGEVGRCPKVWRLHGARRHGVRVTKTRVLLF